MKKRPNPAIATVVKSETVTPNMQRITLESERFSSYPEDCESGYVKLLFSPSGTTDISALPEGDRPRMRTYTIRRFFPEQCRIEIDMVRHTEHGEKTEGAGMAANWAVTTKAGDTIGIAGPGTIQNLNPDADWFFFCADMTALPALTGKLRKLPVSAKGYAVIEVQSADDFQDLDAPEGISLTWVVATENKDVLADAAKALPWQEGIVSIWSASEFSTMRTLRDYFHNERNVDRENIYISSYWKRGVTEEGHKVLKAEDAEANG